MLLTACLILTDACLSSLPLFIMGLLLLADGTHAGFENHRCRFFWEGKGDKRKYRWVSWPEVCLPRDQGGLGIMNTKHMNIALMVKWVWSLFMESSADCLCLRTLRAKYRGDCWGSVQITKKITYATLNCPRSI
jgi:hypothetical protein